MEKNSLLNQRSPLAPFTRPLCVMAKPVGARCNLACSYCYYIDKDQLKAEEARKEMSEGLLEAFVQQYIESQAVSEVQFIWHGGEPMLRGLDFYKKALRLQQRYAGGRHISNVLQTNGTLLTDEWCTFLRRNNFLVGISIDGPEAFHDAYRRNRHGRASHERVMQGIRLLQRHGVEWNAMATVNTANVAHPKEFYHFFRNIFLTTPPTKGSAGSVGYLQFTPITNAPEAIEAEAFGRFLCGVFDEWVRQDVGRIFVQLFDATLANWMGVPPGLCTMGTSCHGAANLETDGRIYACDHFTMPEYQLGTLQMTSSLGTQPIGLQEALWSPAAQDFARRKMEQLSRQCRECEFLFACHGECPRNRLTTDKYGTPHHNILCDGYQMFFRHVAPAMNFMANELRHQRPPANIMLHGF